jgi:hypothetical protein
MVCYGNKTRFFCEYILFNFANICFVRKRAYLRAQGKKFHDFFASALWVEREYFPIGHQLVQSFPSVTNLLHFNVRLSGKFSNI